MDKEKIDITEEEFNQIKGIAYKVYERSFAGIEFDDLLQEGLLAYTIMKKKYNKEKNDYFMGFAYKRIYGAMLDWVAKYSLNKGAAVRKKVSAKDYKIAATPENYEALHYDFGKQEEIAEKDDLYREVERFFCGLSDYEKFIIYYIIYLGYSIKAIEEDITNFKLDKAKLIATNLMYKLKNILEEKGYL